MDCGEMLGQCSEICVVAEIPGCLRALGDGIGPRPIVAPKRELIEKLACRVVEVLTGPCA